MLACVGYLFTKLGFVFSGAIARDGTTFASIAEGAGSNPFAAWALVPLGGKIQAIGLGLGLGLELGVGLGLGCCGES